MGAKIDSAADDDSPISEINVTPFVDVVLVLLVIFIVTAPQMMKDTLGINLPKASSQDTKKALETMGIAITKQGQILLNGKAISDDSLQEEVKRAVEANPETQSVISADADARHGDVVRVIDLIKSSGLTKFAIQIQREK